jgi:hypothetical protein
MRGGVHIKTIGATTELQAVPAADHGAITSRRRSAAINDSIAAIFKKRHEWTNANVQARIPRTALGRVFHAGQGMARGEAGISATFNAIIGSTSDGSSWDA